VKSAGAVSTFNARTFVIGAASVTAIAAALGAWLLLIAGRMPDPVASHWGGSGPADEFSSFASTEALGFGVTLGTGLVCAACFSLNSLSAGLQRFGVGFSITMAGFLAGIFAAGLAPQIGQATAVGTHMNWGIVWACAGAAAVIAVPLALLVRAGGPVTVDAGIPAGAAVDSGAARRHESMSVRIRAATGMYITVGGLTFVAFGLLAVVSPWWLLAAFAFSALVVSFFSAAVSVGAEGLRVTVWGRWRMVHIPVQSFSSVDVAREIRPMRYGGWGYRAGAWGTAFVVRRGPALVLNLGAGRQFVVNVDTVDNAERMAGLLNGYKLGTAKLHA
jgi:hypothetical protein